MPLIMQEYNNLANLCNYGVRLFRRLSFAYEYPDVSLIGSSLSNFLDNVIDARFVHYFYPVVQSIRKKFENNLSFVLQTEVSNIFNAIRNYLMTYHQSQSLGKTAKEDLGIHIHRISSDYQLIHRLLYGVEDEGYYEIYGYIPTSISLLGDSTRYTTPEHKAYSVSYNITYNNGLNPTLSYIPTNNKYWGEYYFCIKSAVPDTFYARADVITPTGNIMDVYYKFDRQEDIDIRGVKTFVMNANPVIGFGTSVYKITNFGVVDGDAPPADSKIIRIKELHIQSTYTYTVDDILLHARLSSDFYTGTEIFMPDMLYQLVVVN